MREGYKRIYDSYCPGPVMEFNHWPAYFSYHHPNSENGQTHSSDYGGHHWRGRFSSAAPFLVPGSEEFTLDKVGAKGMAERGSVLMKSGAKLLQFEEGQSLPKTYNGEMGMPMNSLLSKVITTEERAAQFQNNIRQNIRKEAEEYKRVSQKQSTNAK